MLDKILSNSVLVFFCCSVIFSNSVDISLDFLNKLSSLDFEISFFSFSRFSFFCIKSLFNSSSFFKLLKSILTERFSRSFSNFEKSLTDYLNWRGIL